MTGTLGALSFLDTLMSTTDSTGQTNYTGPTVLLLISLLICFFGYKLYRFWITLIGFVVGMFVGGLLGELFLPNPSTDNVMICSFAGAIIIALMSFLVQKLGVFILCGGISAISMYFLLSQRFHVAQDNAAIVSAILFLVMGGLGVKFQKVFIIGVTSVFGGLSVASALNMLSPLIRSQINQAGESTRFMLTIVPLILIVLGILLQAMTNKNKKK